MAAVTGFHRFIRLFMPNGLFDALEAGTRTFSFDCPCGHSRDLWEAGGVKHSGTEQRTYARCPVCRQRTWHHKRKLRRGEFRESMLAARRDVVLLSAHVWWASVIAWGYAALMWASPLLLIQFLPDPGDFLIVWGVSYVVGWAAPYMWLTTRYRIGRTDLELCAGFMSRKLEMRKIERVSRTRHGVGLSFAFHTDYLWIGYPSRLGGYLVSPQDNALFLELLDQRCSQLEMRDARTVPHR